MEEIEKDEKEIERELPDELKKFIQESNWIWAKTYATFAPHWYIVKYYCNKEIIEKFAQFIRENGVVRKWGKTYGFYLDYDGYSYWGMGEEGHKSKTEDMTIINRKIIEETDKFNEYPKEVFEYSNRINSYQGRFFTREGKSHKEIQKKL